MSLFGCAAGKNRVYPVVGFGWISVATNTEDLSVIKTTLIGPGINMRSQSVVVGYEQSVIVKAKTNADNIIEVK
jgi:hypothetical protein